jgi:hypothetical protein
MISRGPSSPRSGFVSQPFTGLADLFCGLPLSFGRQSEPPGRRIGMTTTPRGRPPDTRGQAMPASSSTHDQPPDGKARMRGAACSQVPVRSVDAYFFHGRSIMNGKSIRIGAGTCFIM